MSDELVILLFLLFLMMMMMMMMIMNLDSLFLYEHGHIANLFFSYPILYSNTGWASYIEKPVDGSSARRIIMHYGLGDHQVTWLGAHAIAKTANAKMFASNVREGNESLAYFDTVPDSTTLTDGSAIMGFDFGFPLNPFINVPPSSGPDAHECPRRAPQAQEQMARFFASGEIVNTCNGPCVLNGCPSGR